MLPKHRVFLNPKSHVNLVVGGPRSGKWTWVAQWLEARRHHIDRLVIVSQNTPNIRALTPALAPYVVTPQTLTRPGSTWLTVLHSAIHRKPRQERWVVVLDQRHGALRRTERRHRFFRDTYGWGTDKNVTLFEVHRTMPALSGFDRVNVDTLTVFPRKDRTVDRALSVLSALSEAPEVVLPAVAAGFPRFHPLMLDWTSGKEKRAVLGPTPVKLLEAPVWEATVKPVPMSVPQLEGSGSDSDSDSDDEDGARPPTPPPTPLPAQPPKTFVAAATSRLWDILVRFLPSK